MTAARDLAAGGGAAARHHDAQVAADLTALAALATRINTSKGHLEELYTQRRDLFRRLMDRGVSQAHIGRVAGVSSMAVAIALGKPKPKT